MIPGEDPLPLPSQVVSQLHSSCLMYHPHPLFASPPWTALKLRNVTGGCFEAQRMIRPLND